MVHLARHGPKPAHLKHQPFEHRDPCGEVFGQKLPGFFAEIKQNCARFKDADRLPVRTLGVDDRGNFVVRANPQERRIELVVLGDINNLNEIG